jgi:hypothetical protein
MLTQPAKQKLPTVVIVDGMEAYVSEGHVESITFKLGDSFRKSDKGYSGACITGFPITVGGRKTKSLQRSTLVEHEPRSFREAVGQHNFSQPRIDTQTRLSHDLDIGGETYADELSALCKTI